MEVSISTKEKLTDKSWHSSQIGELSNNRDGRVNLQAFRVLSKRRPLDVLLSVHPPNSALLGQNGPR